MKKIFTLLLFLLIIPGIFAIDIDVEKKSSDEVMIIDLEKPTIFNLEITNHGSSDNFIFYTFFGAGSYPQETISIGPDQTKEVEFGVYPRSDLSQRGSIIFDLFIKSQDGSEEIVPLLVNVIDLEETFDVGSEEFNPDSNTLQIYIKNKVNFNFDEIQARFKSLFFNFDESFSLQPYEKKNFDVQLNKEDFKKIMAGFYTLETRVKIDSKEANIEGTIKFSEKDILKITKEDYGFIMRTNIIKKSNEGNILSESETIIKKNIITRLFTSLSPQPDIVERQGLTIYYTWERQINPGETLEIIVRTNWLLPLLVIFLIVSIIVLTKKFSGTNLILRKKVSFVKAKGGEFALKVSIFVSAKKYVEKVNVVDRFPPLVKVHERFGAKKPTRISEKTRRIEWDFEKLEAGEMRTLSYIIYSKVGVVGKFALPTATAIYEKDGDVHEAESNRAFLVTEQPREPVGE